MFRANRTRTVGASRAVAAPELGTRTTRKVRQVPIGRVGQGEGREGRKRNQLCQHNGLSDPPTLIPSLTAPAEIYYSTSHDSNATQRYVVLALRVSCRSVAVWLLAKGEM